MLATGLATSGFGAAISGGWNTTYIAPPSPAPTPPYDPAASLTELIAVADSLQASVDSGNLRC